MTRNRHLDNGGPYVAEALRPWVTERLSQGGYRYTGARTVAGWIVADKLGFNVLTASGGRTITDETTARTLAAEWTRG